MNINKHLSEEDMSVTADKVTSFYTVYIGVYPNKITLFFDTKCELIHFRNEVKWAVDAVLKERENEK